MKNMPLHRIAVWCSIIIFAFTINACEQEPILWKVDSTEQVITDYVITNPEKFSEFGKLLESTGLSSLLRVRGPFTLFLPDNAAMQKFYQENGVTSFEQFTDKTLALKLVYNHLIANEIQSGDILLGALRDTNALGDYLVTEFSGIDIIINKKTKIVKRDIRAANGFVHLIDKVIAPVTVSVYDQLASDPSYKLFTEGLKQTGLMDTLKLISFPYGKKSARTRFTILAVADTIYNRYGIKTIGDLINKYTDQPANIKKINNGFYRYMEYHCLGGTYYLSNFTTKLYPILSNDNNISVVIDTDYRLNVDRLTKAYTGFNIDKSNVPAKNGAIHSINDLLPVKQPDPTTITFETTDYFDMKQGDYFGKYYMKWYDGKNTFAKIKWESDYLQYYYKNHDTGELLSDDCLNTNGFGWIEITTPKIMKGKYKLTANLWANQLDYEVYVDGVRTKLIKRADPAKSTSWGEFDWVNTEEHKIKVVAISWGMIFWDTVIFTPITN